MRVRLDGRTGNLPSSGLAPDKLQQLVRLHAKRFNHRMLRGFDLMELQADELCTFIGSTRTIIWLFATIEVSSRLWAGSVLGRRSDRNARAVINNVVRRGRVVGCPLIVTDGFE